MVFKGLSLQFKSLAVLKLLMVRMGKVFITNATIQAFL